METERGEIMVEKVLQDQVNTVVASNRGLEV